MKVITTFFMHQIYIYSLYELFIILILKKCKNTHIFTTIIIIKGY